MRFQLEHRTVYQYLGTASESFMEARLTPVTDDRQRLISRKFTTNPSCNVHLYVDYFGNAVETFSIIHRHEKLELISQSEVETFSAELPRAAVDISVAEAQQIFRSDKLLLFEYLTRSAAIDQPPEAETMAHNFFKPSDPLGPSLLALNDWISREFRYVPGSTRIDTPVSTALHTQMGVCQDFAQVMIAILRAAKLPARYVTGYIETDAQQKASSSAAETPLVGASESHAWVEVFMPGGFWWPLDPTNRCVAGERHVKIGVGRDYQDCTPTRGVFKGTTTEALTVSVVMRRIPRQN